MNEEEYKKTIQKLQESTLKMIIEKNKQIAELEEAKASLEYLLEGRDNEIDELKDDNKVMADNYSKMEQKFYDNLTKAKEIIKKLCIRQDDYCIDCTCYKFLENMRAEAEQFLKECK